MMDNKIEYADQCFSAGFNCAQAVFSSFCEDFGLDKKQALKIACAFGAGIGYQGQVCGAVSGAFLVLGLMYGKNDENDKQSGALTYALAREFSARFSEINGTINCTELLGYDLGDEQQLNAARQSGIFRTHCAKYVRDAVAVLEEMVAEQNKK